MNTKEPESGGRPILLTLFLRCVIHTEGAPSLRVLCERVGVTQAWGHHDPTKEKAISEQIALLCGGTYAEPYAECTLYSRLNLEAISQDAAK